MINIEQHYKTLITAATPISQVIRKPAIMKIWILNISWQRLLVLAGLLVLLFAAGTISQSIVDYLYPEKGAFKSLIGGLFNSPSHQRLEELRESKYLQLHLFFAGLSVTSFVIVLILDLPSAIKKSKQQASELIQQSQAIHSSNPLLAETLTINANNLLLKPLESEMGLNSNSAKSNDPPDELAKTVVASQPRKPERFVGPNQRYRIDKALASGGSGIVYQALDTVLGRQVALKELMEDVASDEEQANRFKVEARALALLNHSHILPVYDLLEENGHFWLVMELMMGGTLGDKIKKAGALSIDETIKVVKGIASGLGIAHQQGFIHRDIKPANILFSTDGSYRITDFGIAKHQSSEVKTKHGLILGSPGYMSPEQAAGEEIDLRSDLYSLGITMYQMLTGELPFQGDTSSVMAQHITKQAQPPSSINSVVGNELDLVILKMLNKKPSDRYQSTEMLIDALKALK